jgi:signal transduction histidine kinase
MAAAPNALDARGMRAATTVPGARVTLGTRGRTAVSTDVSEMPVWRSWMTLLVMTRLLGAAVAIALLALHHVTSHDPLMIAVTAGWTVLTLALFARGERWQTSPAAWLVDGAVAIGLVWLSGDWRSPFYIFALTTLVLPATTLPFRSALGWACGFTAGYLAVAIQTELDAGTLRSSIRVETVATHLMVPIVIALALAYAADLLNRLRDERERSERLALETERQRIAWELHDSAKQRVHAAHLVLSAALGSAEDGARRGIEHAVGELRAAAADMDSSVAELRAPLDSRPVGELLRTRAEELALAADADIEVFGDLPSLRPLVAVHAYRIASEALTNAVRHSRGGRITVTLACGPDDCSIVVADDGVGLPVQPRPGSHGLRTMRGRAASIGAVLRVGERVDGPGTEVALVLPHHLWAGR